MSSEERPVTDSNVIDHVAGPASEERGPNVGWRERVASTVIGGGLLVRGLKRGSLGGAATALVGGILVYRGLTGKSRLYRALEAKAEAEMEMDAGTDRDSEGVDVDDDTRLPTVERSITVGEPADVLADYWRDPDQVSRIVGDFADVFETTGTGGDRHRWRVQAPFGRTIEWETTVVEDEANNQLRWESTEDALVPHECAITFREADNDRGTILDLEIQYEPPGGSLGNAAMDQLGFAPDVLAGTALRRFKSLAETGEIPTTEGNPSARGKGDLI